MRIVKLILSALALTAAHGAALASGGAEEAAKKAPFPVTGFVLVGALTVVIPVLFLVATHLKGPGTEEEEELEPVVSGIGQGRAPIPRWLYGVYVLIPSWALFYLINNTQVRSELAPTPEPTPTPAQRTDRPPATPPPGGVQLVAKDLEFNASSLSLKAGAPAKVEVRNQDPSTPHNFALYKDKSLAESVFKGELFNGVKTQTYTFTAPPAGTYHFQCDVHPTTMSGEAKVE